MTRLYVEDKPWELLWKEVVFVVNTGSFCEYEFQGYQVFIYNDGRQFCTCEHGSHWGLNKKSEFCYHIKSVREAIKNRGSFTWERQEKLGENLI